MEIETICEKCGSKCSHRIKDSIQEVFCTKCDWSIVTSFIPEIVKNTKSFTLTLTNYSYENINQIKLIAKSIEKNLIEAKTMMKNNTKIVITGSAYSIIDFIPELVKNDIHVELQNDFTWISKPNQKEYNVLQN